MLVNTTKQKLREGKVVFGAIVGECAPTSVEVLGRIGFDFIMIDCEHGSMGLLEVEHLVRACETVGITPLARVPDHEPATILRFLDRGIPMIEHIDAIAALDEILSVPGIDVIHCAPNDLAQSMGFPPEEEVVKVRKEVIARCKAAGLPVGIGGNSPRDPAAVAELAKTGATFVTVPALSLLQLGADQFRNGVQAALTD